jgi:pyrrolidone-carboxylate peptidase
MPPLITAFTAFGPFGINPSVEIARGVRGALWPGDETVAFEELEVCFAAVDELVERLLRDPPPFWLMFGVAGNASLPRLERVARNRVGSAPDVRGHTRGPGPIDPDLPDSIGGTLFDPAVPAPEGVVDSDDAGDYLCNYVYWMANTRLSVPCGFVHVAPLDRVPAEAQIERIADALRTCCTLPSL